MSQANFLNANQVLLRFCKSKVDGREYICETVPFGGEYREASWFLGELDDDIFQIVRFDRKALKADDVTERLAYEFLKSFDADPVRGPVEIESEPDFPQYVVQSRVWAAWKDELEAERPVTGPDMVRIERRELAMEGL